MFDVFKQYLSEKGASFTEAELERIKQYSISKKIKRRRYLLHEGETMHYFCFVTKGCLRLYRVGEDGTEHILRFAPENWWITEAESIESGKGSRSNIDALEDSEVLLWRAEDFRQLLREIPQLRDLSDQVTLRNVIANMNRIYAHISASAEEQYNQFIQAYPNIFNRVPLHMIASYLGLSPKTITRIRQHKAQKSIIAETFVPIIR